jgi:hypothetical protein
MKTIDWTAERTVLTVHPRIVATIMREQDVDVMLFDDEIDDRTWAQWCDGDGELWQAVQFTRSYNRYTPGQNVPVMGTIIRRSREGLEGCWTHVTLRGGRRYRYPSDQDPHVSGIQLKLIGIRGYKWSDVRPMLKPEEIDEIYAGDFSLFDAPPEEPEYPHLDDPTAGLH